MFSDLIIKSYHLIMHQFNCKSSHTHKITEQCKRTFLEEIKLKPTLIILAASKRIRQRSMPDFLLHILKAAFAS